MSWIVEKLVRKLAPVVAPVVTPIAKKALVALAGVVASGLAAGPILFPPIVPRLPLVPFLPIITNGASGGAHGGTFDPARPRLELTTTTYNILGKEHKTEADRPELLGLGRTIGAEKPDVVALQEVWSRRGFDQAEIIAQAAGDYRVLHGVALNGIQGGWDYGVALLVRKGGPLDLRVVSSENLLHPKALFVGRDEQRTALVADLASKDGRTFRVIATHLSLEERSRQLQVERLRELARGHSSIVLGDFNAEAGSRNVRTLTQGGFTDAYAQANPGERGATFPSSGRRIDYTLLSRGVALSSSVETGGKLSDHDAVVSRVVVNTNGITGALE